MAELRERTHFNVVRLSDAPERLAVFPIDPLARRPLSKAMGLGLVRTATTPQQHKQTSLTLLAEGSGCGTYDSV